MLTGTHDTGTKHFIGRGIRQRFVGIEEFGVVEWERRRMYTSLPSLK